MVTASSVTPVTANFVKPPPELNELYQRHSDMVYRAALRVTGNPADAEDVLQNVFLRMINNRATPDAAGSPEKYFRRAAINAAIDVLRRKRWLGEIEIDDTRDHGGRDDSALPKEALRRAIAKLPPQDAQLFVLCYLEGYSYDELAHQFQLERGTVGSRLHRIRATLQKELS